MEILLVAMRKIIQLRAMRHLRIRITKSILMMMRRLIKKALLSMAMAGMCLSKFMMNKVAAYSSLVLMAKDRRLTSVGFRSATSSMLMVDLLITPAPRGLMERKQNPRRF